MIFTERSFLLTSTISNLVKNGFDQRRSCTVMEDHGRISNLSISGSCSRIPLEGYDVNRAGLTAAPPIFTR
jgi:hypothetical protein